MKILQYCKCRVACIVIAATWLAMMSVGLTRAAATSLVPYQDAYQLHILSSINNPDGTRDQVYLGQGTATHCGIIQVEIQVHIESTQYDPVLNSFFIDFSGTEILTAANGDALFSTLNGTEYLPLDSVGNVLPPPFHIEGNQEISGGTGRFMGASGSLTFAGSDHNDGTITVSSAGVVSSVGSTQ